MNVGVLGGTFDPPHKAHIKIAERSIEQFNLDKVIFIPSRSEERRVGKECER